MHTPFFVCPFQPQIVFRQFFFQKHVSKQLENLIFHSQTFQLWIYWLNAENENWCGKYANLNVWYFWKFLHLLAYFHNFMLYSQFFLFRMLDGHLMDLISWKNLVLNPLFFLLRPLEYAYPHNPHISQWTQTWKISLINISSEND